jgi:ribosomal protection tetracycline resistance protein
MATLNLGILAHVDAGKTTLTERLLYAAGVIDEVGSVDRGTTQTDSLALERQRGITIKSAVASFAIDDVTINLIDTPGHPDFIAEVERALGVLDGAILVLSAVEGVQPQTRILMRALQRLRVPTLLFVNKIDRRGAGDARVLRAIAERLSAAIVPMGTTHGLGTRTAEFVPADDTDGAFTDRLAGELAEHNESILAEYLDDVGTLSYAHLRSELTAQTRHALVYPVYFGSAMTGAGIGALVAGILELLPTNIGATNDPPSGTVFKIEQSAGGQRIAYVRMFSGTIRTRDLVEFGRENKQRVTALHVFEHGGAVQRPFVAAGEIAKLWGLPNIQIGDRIGPPGARAAHQSFAPPTMESVVFANRSGDGARLHHALTQLAEQDPLINVRQDPRRGDLSVSLYGEVQKQVIGSTLASDFGIDVTFRETTTIYIERPVGKGHAVALLQEDANPFSATIGLVVEPAPIGSDIEFRLDVDPRTLPIFIYKTADKFVESMRQYVCDVLREGLFGWQVRDCLVTMSECGYYASDGPTKPTLPTPRSTAADFRKLTPLVLMRALKAAKTVVCEPMMGVNIEVPSNTVSAVLAAVARLGGTAATPSMMGDLTTISTTMAGARARELQQQVPGLTGGEGVVQADLGGYQPVRGAPPTRRRARAAPRQRDEYRDELTDGTRATGRQPRDPEEE